MAVNRETIEIALEGLHKLDELDRKLRSLSALAEDLSGAIAQIGEEAKGTSSELRTFSKGTNRLRVVSRTVGGAASDRNTVSGLSASEVSATKRALRNRAASLDAEIKSRREIARGLLETLRDQRSEQSKLNTIKNNTVKEELKIAAEKTRYKEALIEARKGILSEVTRTRLQARSRNTDTLFRRYRETRQRLTVDSNLPPNLQSRSRGLQRSLDAVETQYASLRRASAALSRTAKASGADSDKILSERQKIESAKASLKTEYRSLVEQLRELNRASSGRKYEFNQRRILSERADALQRATGMGLSSRAARLDENTRNQLRKKLATASDLAASGNIEGARAIRKEVETTIAAKERQLKLDKQIVRENERGTASLVSLDKQRVSEQSKYAKAVRSIETQQRQISQLSSQGGAGTQNFERARTSAQRLPGLLQSGDYRAFEDELKNATTYARYAREDLGLRNKYSKNTAKYENQISKISADILSGKKVEFSQVDKLNKFYDSQRGPGGPGGRGFLALPPAKPGSPAYSAGQGMNVRPGIRASQSMINGVPQPKIVEVLGGTRTEQKAQADLNGTLQRQAEYNDKILQTKKAEEIVTAGIQKKTKDTVSAAQSLEKQRRAEVTSLDKSLNNIELLKARLEDLRKIGGTGRFFNDAKANIESMTGFLQQGNGLGYDLANNRAITALTLGERQVRSSKREERQTLARQKAEQKVVNTYNSLQSAVDTLNIKTQKYQETASGAFNYDDLNKWVSGVLDLESTYTQLNKLGKKELDSFDQKLKKELEYGNRIKKSSNLVADGLAIEQKLLGLKDSGAQVDARLFTLQNAINKSRQNGAQVSLADLNILEEEVKASRQLVTLENARMARMRKAATGSTPEDKLSKLTAAGDKTIANLTGAQAKGIEVTPQLVALQEILNKVRKDGYTIASEDLDLLQKQTAEANRLLSVENTRFRVASGISRSRQKILSGVASAGSELTSLFDSGAIGAELYKKRRDALIGIGTSARSGSLPSTVLERKLKFQKSQIKDLVPQQSQDPSRIIAGVATAGKKLDDLARSGSISEGIASGLRKKLIDIGSAARQGAKPIDELSNSLRELTTRMSLVDKKGGSTDLSGRLNRAINLGEKLQGPLGNLSLKRSTLDQADPRRIATEKLILDLQNSINAAKQTDYNITLDGVSALEQQVSAAQALLATEKQQSGLAKERLAIAKRSGSGRLPQLQRETLTSALGDMANSSVAAKVYRGGRGLPSAISQVVTTFNAAVNEGDGGAQAGANVVQTFIQKIFAGKSKAKQAGLDLTSASADGMKEGLGIQSPSKVMIEIVRNLTETYIAELQKAIPQVEAASKKLAEASAQQMSASSGIDNSREGIAARANIPINAVAKSNSESHLNAYARAMVTYGLDPASQPTDSVSANQMQQKALDTIKATGNQYPLLENVPGFNWDAFQNDKIVGRDSQHVQRARQIFQDFYNIDGAGNVKSSQPVNNGAQALQAAQQEAAQLSGAVSELLGGVDVITGAFKTAAQLADASAKKAQEMGSGKLASTSSSPFEEAKRRAAEIDAQNAAKAQEQMAIASQFRPSIDAAMQADRSAASQQIYDSFAPARAQAEADARAAAAASSKAIDQASASPIDQGEAEVKTSIQRLFERLSGSINGLMGGGGGGGGGGRPPSGPPGSGDFLFPPDGPGSGPRGGGGGKGLLGLDRAALEAQPGLKNLARLSKASSSQLEQLMQILTNLRNDAKVSDKEYKNLTKAIRKVSDQMQRRDPNADILTRKFGERGGRAVGEGLIGGAFPLLFGQGIGASIGGGVGGAAGGFAGGMLGFGLSLVGTAIGSAVDALIAGAQETGKMMTDLLGNFDQLSEAGLTLSRSQDSVIKSMMENGNKTAAYNAVEQEMRSKFGQDGIDKLKKASEAGDGFNRALAELGVQMQIFVAGPLTDFLNAMAEALSGMGAEQRTRQLLETLPAKERKQMQTDLERAAKKAVENNPTFNGPLSFFRGFDPKKAGTIDGTGERRVIGNRELRSIIARYSNVDIGGTASPLAVVDANVRAKEDALKKAQMANDLVSKQQEVQAASRDLRQQIISVAREQEDLNRQNFETRREYEKQIADIRRSVEERITQLAIANRQKENEIIVKQGQIQEQVLKNAFASVNGELSTDKLATDLAAAVSTYLSSQLSAENDIQQKRLQYQIELSNQQIELEKFKADTARTVAELNYSTARKVADVNLSVARKNEDAALNQFAIQKKIAVVKGQMINLELELMSAQDKQQLAGIIVSNVDRPETKAVNAPVERWLRERIKEIDKIVSTVTAETNRMVDLQPPPKLTGMTLPAMQKVDTSGLDALAARSKKLQEQFIGLEEELTQLIKLGHAKEFRNTLFKTAFADSAQLKTSLTEVMSTYDKTINDIPRLQEAIAKSYEELIKSLAKNGQALTKAQLDYIVSFQLGQQKMEELRPTMEFYINSFTEAGDSINSSRKSINDLLGPITMYERVLQRINQSGGIDVNPEENKRLLEAAKNADDLSKKLKVLSALNDIAGGMTDSLIEFNKQLLTGGDLVESMKAYLEGVANKTLDVLLEFTLRPMQDALFKDLAKWLGIEQEKNPLLLPIEAIRDTVAKILQKSEAPFNREAVGIASQQQAAATAAASQAAAQQQLQAATTAPAAAMPVAAMSTAAGYTGYFGETGNVRNKDPNWIHGHLQSTIGSAVQTIDDGIRLARAAFAKGIPVEVGSGVTTPINSTMSDAQLRQIMANAINQHAHSGGGTAFDFWVPKTMNGKPTQVPLPLTDIRRPNGGNEGISGLLPGEKTFLGHLDPRSLNKIPFAGATGQLPSAANPIPVSIVGGQSQQVAGQVGAQPLPAPVPVPGFPAARTFPAAEQPAAQAQQPLPAAAAGLTIQSTQATQTAQEAAIAQQQSTSNALAQLAASAQEVSRAFAGIQQTTAAQTTAVQRQADATTAATTATTAQSSAAAANGTATSRSTDKLVDGTNKFQATAAVGLQAMSSIAMAYSGVMMMKQGGTYNTLMGLAGIFGGISGLFRGSYGFGKLLGFAEGGRPKPNDPIMIGEKGPELWVPDRPGTIIPNDQLFVPGLDSSGSTSQQSNSSANDTGSTGASSNGSYSRSDGLMFNDTRAALAKTENKSNNEPMQLGPMPAIDIRYESQTINNVEYVTVEQHRKGMQEAAKRGQLLAYQGLQHSVKVRRRVGI